MTIKLEKLKARLLANPKVKAEYALAPAAELLRLMRATTPKRARAAGMSPSGSRVA